MNINANAEKITDLKSSTNQKKKKNYIRKRKKEKWAYKRSVQSHGNVLKHLLPNKRSKEHIESKTQC